MFLNDFPRLLFTVLAGVAILVGERGAGLEQAGAQIRASLSPNDGVSRRSRPK